MKQHKLTDDEYTAFVTLNSNVTQAKMAVYQIQVEKEQLESKLRDALKQVSVNEHQFQGVLAYALQTNGMQKGKIALTAEGGFLTEEE